MKRYPYPILVSFLTVAVISCSEVEDMPLENYPATHTVRISVYSATDESEALQDAELHLYRGQTLLKVFSADEEIDIARWSQEDTKDFQVRVLSEGYEPGELEFPYILNQRLARRPLVVKLKPAIEIVVTPFSVEEPDDFVISLEGSGVITVVWPDNTSETAEMPLSFDHGFDTASGRTILLKGDVRNITSFRSFGYSTWVSDISGLKHLKNMSSFQPGPLLYSEKLDLRHSKELELIDLFHSTLPEWFMLPQQHAIHSITVSLGDRSITTGEIDLLIDNIYRNTIRRKIFNGMISLTDSNAPSPSALEKIRILQDDYGWNINLNL